MGIGLSQSVHTEKVGCDPAAASTKNQGTLKAEGGKEHTLVAFADTESVTEAVDQFLQEANLQKRPPDALREFVFIHITPELVEIEGEIADLLRQLAAKQDGKASENTQAHSKGEKPRLGTNSHVREGQQSRSAGNSQAQGNGAPRGTEVVYSSLFTLARTFNSTLAGKREQVKNDTPKNERPLGKEVGRSAFLSTCASPFERITQEQSRFERDGEGQQNQKGQDEENEQGGQHNPHEKGSNSQSEKKKGINAISGMQAGVGRTPSASKDGGRVQATGSSSHASPQKVVGSVENIYIRFMALMARILGQAEREAHELYLRIKERTDNVDVLTLLLSKINSEKGPIDWTQNEEMKALIEKARAIGVDIPLDKLTWTEEEKKLFKENIQMRKDSMEKVTQLERTDMQRYLQEASQCHQARSNILKLLKEVTDTILANLRP